jgi:2',3'-cyclic-nucleotide 2'-phosphodiesterase (5'-nucleotidase family)
MSRKPWRALALCLLLLAPLAAEVRPLTILHTNDLHARLQPVDSRHGGFAYVASVLRRERAGCTSCILLNAGDLVQGTPVSTIFQGLPVYEIGNLFGFDASTLGNHEFDYGWMQARKFLQTARYPIVTANLLDPTGRPFTPKPYVILNAAGLRVAVIGALTETLDTLTMPRQLDGCRTTPLVAAVRRYAAELKAQSDLIVVLAHVTPEEESELLKAVTEAPVFVTGHLHDGMREARVQDGRILVRVASYGVEVGRLDLQVDTEKKAPVKWNWKRIPVDPAARTPAPDVAAQVERWESQVSARVDRPLAMAPRRLEKRDVIRMMEQAMRDEARADFAFINAGAVREAMPQGQWLERHIWNLMPFDDDVVVGTFKGRDLPRVVLQGRRVDPAGDYRLAVTDFIAANQQSDENLRTRGLKFPENTGLLRDLLIDWCRKRKVID